MKIFFTKKARLRILALVEYLADEVKMPQTGLRYADKMIAFGNSLGTFPYKYPECRFKSLKAKGYRCAVFDKKWIFVYSISNRIVIRDIRLAASFKS